MRFISGKDVRSVIFYQRTDDTIMMREARKEAEHETYTVEFDPHVESMGYDGKST